MIDPMPVRWRAQFDDSIGGWCCTFPESDKKTPAEGAMSLGSFLTEQTARDVATLHNKWLFGLNDEGQTRATSILGFIWCFVDDCPDYICNGPHHEVETSLGFERLREDQSPIGKPVTKESND